MYKNDSMCDQYDNATFVAFPDTLRDVVSGSDLGLVIFDQQKKQGFVCNIGTPTDAIGTAQLITDITYALEHDDAKLEALVCGISPTIEHLYVRRTKEENDSLTQAIKVEVLEVLKKRGVKKIIEKYGEKPNGSTEYGVHSESGEMFAVEEDRDESCGYLTPQDLIDLGFEDDTH